MKTLSANKYLDFTSTSFSLNFALNFFCFFFFSCKLDMNINCLGNSYNILYLGRNPVINKLQSQLDVLLSYKCKFYQRTVDSRYLDFGYLE